METLPSYLQAVTPYLDKYGYWAIFFGVLLEDFGVPTPGETLLIAGAMFAAMGDFKIYWVILLTFVGAIAGDNIGYAIGYFGGRKLVLKFGRYLFLKEKRLHRLEQFFDRHGGKVVAIARFIEGLRQFNGVVAGLSGMQWSRFLSFNILGAALWVGLWGSISYFLGSQLSTLLANFKQFEVYILAALFFLASFFFARYLFKKQFEQHNPGT